MKTRNSERKKSGAKKTLTVAIIAAVIVAAALGVYFWHLKHSGGNAGNVLPVGVSEALASSGATDTSNVFGAYGITSADTDETAFDVENMESSLEIEEVYVSSGESITEGEKILKFTDDSVETVREELTKALREAELAYRSGVIEYEQSKITAKYEKELTELEGTEADEVYEETVNSLQASVDRAKESLDEANEQIEEYQNEMDNDTYLAAYNEAKAEYDTNLEILKKKLVEWSVDWSEITGNQRMMNLSDLHSQYVYVLSKYYSILEGNLEDMNAAETEYEENGTDAIISYELIYLQYQLASYKKTYEEAKESYEINVIEAGLTRENTKNEASKAEENYETDMDKAEADYEELKDAYDTATEALENFEALAGDGYFYAEDTGTILRMSLRKGRKVTTDTVIYTMINSDHMTVSVSVDEDNISRVSVGDTVIVYSEDSGTFYGTVETVSPVSSSSQTGSVTYSVTVAMAGDFSGLSNNETVSVYFGMGGTK